MWFWLTLKHMCKANFPRFCCNAWVRSNSAGMPPVGVGEQLAQLGNGLRAAENPNGTVRLAALGERPFTGAPLWGTALVGYDKLHLPVVLHDLFCQPRAPVPVDMAGIVGLAGVGAAHNEGAKTRLCATVGSAQLRGNHGPQRFGLHLWGVVAGLVNRAWRKAQADERLRRTSPWSPQAWRTRGRAVVQGKPLRDCIRAPKMDDGTGADEHERVKLRQCVLRLLQGRQLCGVGHWRNGQKRQPLRINAFSAQGIEPRLRQ